MVLSSAVEVAKALLASIVAPKTFSKRASADFLVWLFQYSMGAMW